MRTSLNETEQIEAYLLQPADKGESLLFDARAILNPALHDKMIWQQKAYEIVHLYGRKQLQQEIRAVHLKLFSLPEHAGFRQRIKRLFQKR